MPLPKSWTTVTPLSKTIAIILFAILPLIAFFLGVRYQQKITPQRDLSQMSTEVSPTATPTPYKQLNTVVSITRDNQKLCIAPVHKFSIKVPFDWECSLEEADDHYQMTIKSNDKESITITNMWGDAYLACELSQEELNKSALYKDYNCTKTTLIQNPEFSLKRYEEKGAEASQTNSAIIGRFFTPFRLGGDCSLIKCPIISVNTKTKDHMLTQEQVNKIAAILSTFQIPR